MPSRGESLVGRENGCCCGSSAEAEALPRSCVFFFFFLNQHLYSAIATYTRARRGGANP